MVKVNQRFANSADASLGQIKTHHALTTQSVVIHGDGKTASASSYFTASHFGTASRTGESLTAYGTYVDELICVPGEPSVPGASGKWFIKSRDLLFTARIGDEQIMDDK